MLRVFRVNIGFLTWLRYTLWIVLFPLGFVCEGIFWMTYDESDDFKISKF